MLAELVPLACSTWYQCLPVRRTISVATDDEYDLNLGS